jgi:hypothetical protein
MNTVLVSGTLAGVSQRRLGQSDRVLYERRLDVTRRAAGVASRRGW